MTSEDFNRSAENIIGKCIDTLCVKAKEYATDDRLHNFHIAAKLMGCSTERALAGMMAKHTISVYDMCVSGKAYPLELWEEKIGDSINYLLLLNAAIRDNDTTIRL